MAAGALGTMARVAPTTPGPVLPINVSLDFAHIGTFDLFTGSGADNICIDQPDLPLRCPRGCGSTWA